MLQDQVTPQPFEDINEVLQREFGADAHELFAEFEEHSTAAASLAQVRDSCCMQQITAHKRIENERLDNILCAQQYHFHVNARCTRRGC